MDVLFQNLLNASFHGSIVICAVLVLRFLLKRAPKNTICLLWLLVGLRLLVPFEIESRFSLQPNVEPVAQSQWGQMEVLGTVADENQAMIPAETIRPEEIAESTKTVVQAAPVEEKSSVNWAELLPYGWLAVVLGMVGYSLISYLRLKRRVAGSVILTEGVWICPGLDTAFVLGFFRPQIYLPTGISESEQEFVLAHEKCHIRRGDHWWKLLGFIALSAHWFNPLVWVAYILLCRDLEMACDEAVIRNLSLDDRKAYSQALVSCAAQHRSIAACPVAFGEVSVRERIKSVMNYKKPKFWIILAAVIAVAVTGVCFLTIPKADDKETAARLGGNVYTWEKKYGDTFSFEIELDEDGTFCFVDGLVTYYVALGEWTVEDDVLKLRDDVAPSGARYFYFRVEGDELVYLAEKSAAFSYTDVDDGDRFYMVEDIGNEEEMLARCREAIESWKNVENFHVRQYNSYAGNILDATSEVDYWKSGNDWLYTVSLPETDNGRIFYRLKKDGVEYQQEFYETLTDDPEGWPWFVAEDTSDCMEGNWYKAFDWENANVQYVRTDIINNNQERVTLTVLEDPSAFGKYCPYTVQFLFDSDGVPICVCMTQDENKGARDWRRTDSSYISCDCQENTAKIEEAYAECLAVLGKEDASDPVYCQDKDCTDSSHDHSGIHCTDVSCTNTSHDHSAIYCTEASCTNTSHDHSGISCMDTGCTNAAHDHSARDCTDNGHEDDHRKH